MRIVFFSDDVNNLEKYCGFDGYVVAKAVKAEEKCRWGRVPG
jgi:hypothetical protein